MPMPMGVDNPSEEIIPSLLVMSNERDYDRINRSCFAQYFANIWQHLKPCPRFRLESGSVIRKIMIFSFKFFIISLVQNSLKEYSDLFR